MNWSKVSPTTQILIVINVVLMFFMYYTSSSMVLTREVLIFFGAVGVNTDFYSTFVYMFLHASLLHMVVNMYLLMNYGTEVEKAFGNFFLPIYLGSGILAGLAIHFLQSPNSVTVGASGAICGLVGAKLTHYFMNKNRTEEDRKMLKWVGVDALVLLSLGLLPQVSGISHFFGFASGIAITLAYFLIYLKYAKKQSDPVIE